MSNKKEKKKGSCGSVLIAFIALALISSCVSGGGDDKEDKKETEVVQEQQEQTQPQESQEPQELSFVEVVTNDSDAETASEVIAAISEIGYDESEIKLIEKLDGANLYQVSLAGEQFKVVAMKDACRIWNGSLVLYEDGKVVTDRQKVEDTAISHYDYDVYYRMAQNIIKDCLKDPSSAKFPSSFGDEYGVQRNKDLIVVSSYVTATNSFGAKMQSQFVVQYKLIDKDNYLCEPIYIKLGDEKTGTFIDMDTY